MEVLVKSRFNPGDIVYGYCDRGLQKFKVEDVTLSFDSRFNRTRVEYGCKALMGEDCDITFNETLEESRLTTKADIAKALQNLLNDESQGIN